MNMLGRRCPLWVESGRGGSEERTSVTAICRRESDPIPQQLWRVRKFGLCEVVTSDTSAPHIARQQRSKRTRQAIFEAGAILFSSKGYAASGVREIAKAAGVNQALVSYHFGGKAGLYDSILSEGVAHATTLAKKAVFEDIDNAEKELVRTFAKALTSRPYLVPMILREQLDPDRLLDPNASYKLTGFMALTEQMLAAIPLHDRARKYDPQIIHLICVGPLIQFLVATRVREATADKMKRIISTPKLEEFVETLGEVLSLALRSGDKH